MKNAKVFCYLFLACFLASEPCHGEMNRNYAYLYFENGHPPTLGPSRRQIGSAYNNARANPDIVIQTGYYSLRLDCDTLTLSGYDSLDGSDYLSALTEDVTVFTPASLALSAHIGETQYHCTGGIIQDDDNQYIRFIQGGQFVQRFDHTKLTFTSDGGDIIYGRLEVTAWPDHVTFTLDLSEETSVTRTSIAITSPEETTHQAQTDTGQTSLTISPHDDLAYLPLDPAAHISAATDWRDNTLTSQWDELENAIKLNTPTPGLSHAAQKHTIHEFTFTVSNPGTEELQLPLIFDPGRPRAVTGTVMLLCKADGSPSGIPIQISKNWHGTAGSTPHAGSWLRGYTMIPLAPGQTETYQLRIVYGYWGSGTFGSVSHSSLSLIGWSNQSVWKWDEAALGAWGESMTYDISQHAGGSVVGDVRPTFTTPFNGQTDHNWTENVGGADFLVYKDSSNTYRPSKKLKTCYRWTGPNMTEVWYSGVTSDDTIRFTYRTRAVGTQDYNRRFHSYKYDFLTDVVEPRRLSYYQMSSDYYMTTTFTDYYEGDGDGLGSQRTANPGGNTYKETPFPFQSRWLAIDDLTTSTGHTPNGYRGLISMSSQYNGQPQTLYAHPYGRSWGSSTTLFEISAASISQSYQAGDTIEGEVSFVLPAKSPSVYWGEDTEFVGRMTEYSEPWNAIHDEYRYNHEIDVTVTTGELLNSYPLEINATHGSILAEFTINQGGIGHLPVVLKNVYPGTNPQVQRWTGDQWAPLEDVDTDTHSYYQGYLNAASTMDYAFSIKRPTSDLAEAWSIRIVAPVESYDLWKSSFGIQGGSTPQLDLDYDNMDPNLEYALGGNPRVSDTDLLPKFEVGANEVICAFHRTTASLPVVSITLQHSQDMETWTDMAIPETSNADVTIGPDIDGLQLVEVRFPSYDKMFVRLVATPIE